MSTVRYIGNDIAEFYLSGEKRGKKSLKATLFWGDSIEAIDSKHARIYRDEWKPETDQTVPGQGTTRGRYVRLAHECDMPKGVKFIEKSQIPLRVRFIDVGQGDGAIIQTPEGRILLLDGGEGEHMRRYIRVAFSHVLRTKPLHCDAVIATHGDTDHYVGLMRLMTATRNSAGSPMITADRFFHNGLVKRQKKGSFGTTKKAGKRTYITGLVDNLLSGSSSDWSDSFNKLRVALQTLRQKSGGLTVHRLRYGQHDAFDFLDDSLDMRVLGPIIEEVGGKEALRTLGSSGETVNGHSIVLKLTYGHIRFLFGADLNEPSEEALRKRAFDDGVSLAAEVLKVPHHGSADFSPKILEAIRPVVSVVSSGDESEAKEYIHPRAGLIGALGKYSSPTVERPLIYVTEMVAFFNRLGRVQYQKETDSGRWGKKSGVITNAYNKSAFGIVHVRTNGERVLVATHSGKTTDKESYVFRVDNSGTVHFEDKADIV